MKLMKRLVQLLCLIALTGTFFVLAGCNRGNRFSTHTISDEQYYRFNFENGIGPMDHFVGEVISYNLVWPDKGAISPAAERELMFLCFGDSTASDVKEAAYNWLEATSMASFEYLDDILVEMVDDLDEKDLAYCKMESSCQQDSQLATFIVRNESFWPRAVHGIYSVDYLTVDLESGNTIHLADLVVDTNLLCEAIAHAIQDLDVNKETRECLFDEFVDVDRMPMPHNFAVDSARNNINVFYGLYEITPYCCGIQSIILPIFWLSKHVPLTTYAKRLFGPESYLE